MRFIDTLPSIYDIENHRDQVTVPQAKINIMMVYVHTVALGAVLQLHEGLARKGDDDSYAKCMGAAASVTNIIYAVKRLKSTVVFRPMGVSDTSPAFRRVIKQTDLMDMDCRWSGSLPSLFSSGNSSHSSAYPSPTAFASNDSALTSTL